MAYTKKTKEQIQKTIDAKFDAIVDSIIEAIEEKQELTWRKGWKGFVASNYLTKANYTGINSLLLNYVYADKFELPFYMTFKQAASLGGKVKKGSKGISLVRYNSVFYSDSKKVSYSEAKKLEEAGKIVNKATYAKFFTVFNISQIEGIEVEVPVLNEESKIERCEEIISSYVSKNNIEFSSTNGDKAFYSTSSDKITVPNINLFENANEYYSTVFHEAIHSTGHSSRLNRKFGKSFGDTLYSKEELVAELGAAFLCLEAGIQNDDTTRNSIAYIKGWSTYLKNNKKEVLKASQLAQKAVSFILGK